MAFRSSTERRRAALALALGVGLALSLEGAARAGEPDAEEDLRRGVVLRREGKDAEALQAFERALATSPSPRARAQVALAEQALALWLLAERDLVLALAEPDNAWIRQNREALERAARVVAGKLAWIVVEPVGPGGTVWVNGIASSPGPDGRIRVVAGQVGIEVRYEGRAPVSRTVQVAPETTAKVAIEAGALVSPRAKDPGAPRSPDERRAEGGSLRTTGWVLAGVGVLGVGVGGYFGLRAMSKKDERDADCQSGCTQVGVDADRAGRTAALVSTLALAAGVVATSAGIYLVVTSPSPDSGRAASVGIGASGTSLQLRGTF
jgi:hypothetical protein